MSIQAEIKETIELIEKLKEDRDKVKWNVSYIALANVIEAHEKHLLMLRKEEAGEYDK